MVIYLIVFFVSCLFFHLASKKKKSVNFFGIIGVLLPSFLGGMRDINVGTDTVVYKYLYDVAIEDNFLSFELKTSVEPGYYIISELSNLFTGFSTLLFIYQLLCIVPIYLVGHKLRKHMPLWLVMFLYFTLIYSSTYNIMRQCVCISLLVFASLYLVDGKQLKFWIISTIGMVFHTSCIIGAVFIWIINYLRTRSVRSQNILIPLYICGLLLLFVFFFKIGPILAYIGIGRMEEYGNIYATATHSYVPKTDIIFRLMFFIILWCVSITRSAQKELTRTYFIILIGEVGLMTLGIYNNFLVRVAMYLTIFQLFFLPGLVNNKKIRPGIRARMNLMLAFTSLLYWFWTIVYRESNEIVPYVFAWT